MIEYTNQAQIARAHLLRGSNALLVFIEDATCQNMHVRILNKLLGRQNAISHVFPLYSRKNVIEAAIADKGDDPKRVYLIDGDFDLLTGRPIPSVKQLCRLRAYSIENLLFSEPSLIGVAEECSIDDSKDSLKKKMKFESQWQGLIRELEYLFIHYAIVSHLDLPIVTIGFNVLRLVEEESDTIVVTRSKVKQRLKEVRKEIVTRIGWKVFREEMKAMRFRSRALEDKSLYISGKDYLLPVVHAFLRKRFGLRDSYRGLSVRLAGLVEPGLAPEFRDFVQDAEKNAFALSGSPH
jgi:hypothetical protein